MQTFVWLGQASTWEMSISSNKKDQDLLVMPHAQQYVGMENAFSILLYASMM